MTVDGNFSDTCSLHDIPVDIFILISVVLVILDVQVTECAFFHKGDFTYGIDERRERSVVFL